MVYESPSACLEFRYRIPYTLLFKPEKTDRARQYAPEIECRRTQERNFATLSANPRSGDDPRNCSSYRAIDLLDTGTPVGSTRRDTRGACSGPGQTAGNNLRRQPAVQARARIPADKVVSARPSDSDFSLRLVYANHPRHCAPARNPSLHSRAYRAANTVWLFRDLGGFFTRQVIQTID